MFGFVPLFLRSWSAADACAASFSFHAGSSDDIMLGLRLTFQRKGDSGWQVQPLFFMKWPLALRRGVISFVPLNAVQCLYECVVVFCCAVSNWIV